MHQAGHFLGLRTQGFELRAGELGLQHHDFRQAFRFGERLGQIEEGIGIETQQIDRLVVDRGLAIGSHLEGALEGFRRFFGGAAQALVGKLRTLNAAFGGEAQHLLQIGDRSRRRMQDVGRRFRRRLRLG